MRGRLRRCLINLGGVGRRGSWGALGRYITKHGNAGSIHLRQQTQQALGILEQWRLASETRVGIGSNMLGNGDRTRKTSSSEPYK